MPELVAHRVPATLYLATEHVESGRAFPDNGRPVSWAALRDALSTGLVTIGSHTHTHRLLDRVGAAEAASELDRSIGLIEDRLGVGCSHFAYPKALLGSPGAEQGREGRQSVGPMDFDESDRPRARAGGDDRKRGGRHGAPRRSAGIHGAAR